MMATLLVGFDTFYFLIYFLKYILLCSSYFQRKPIGAVIVEKPNLNFNIE